MNTEQFIPQFYKACLRGFRPDPDLTVTQWADRYRMLPRKSSAEPGRYRSARTPYAREIMDALSTGSPVSEVCVMKATQLGFTELGNNWFGYVVDITPGPMMMVFPTLDLARDHSKQKMQPTINETQRLKDKIPRKPFARQRQHHRHERIPRRDHLFVRVQLRRLLPIEVHPVSVPG